MCKSLDEDEWYLDEFYDAESAPDSLLDFVPKLPDEFIEAINTLHNYMKEHVKFLEGYTSHNGASISIMKKIWQIEDESSQICDTFSWACFIAEDKDYNNTLNYLHQKYDEIIAGKKVAEKYWDTLPAQILLLT